MVQKTNNYIYQYKFLFYLSWICLYLVFPAWISRHTIFQGNDLINLSDPFARSFVILGLITFFSISAYIINRIFSTLIIDKPVIIKSNDWFQHIKDNIWLVIVCCLSVVLQIYPLSIVEVGYVNQGVWLYDLSSNFWHRFFDFPIQYGFWSGIILVFLIVKKTNAIDSLSKCLSEKSSICKSNILLNLICLISLFGFISLYSFFYPYSGGEVSQVLRYPPVSKLFNLFTYYGFGVSHIGPRIVQLIFYLLSAVYLYRTIYLFYEKGTALLGATIYLFSPAIFFHASMSFFACGAVFFMIIISFYFLKFMRNNDNRDLILTTYFIGIGFMYKRSVLLMFMICLAYLLLDTMKKRDLSMTVHIKILLLSLLTIVPWLKIGPGIYKAIWTNLITFDELIVFAMMIKSQISWIVLLLFLVSIIYVLFSKKDDLLLFYGLFFTAYYSFFTLMEAGEFNHRYAMALYPAIAVSIAHFIFSITQRIRWQHSFKLVSVVFSFYLIFLCLVPRASSNLISFKYEDFEIQYYPIAKATEWIKNMTDSDDKVLSLFIPGGIQFYVERIYADRDRINPKRFIYYTHSMSTDLMYPLQNLKDFCDKNKISYIMFPFGPKNSAPDSGATKEAKYLAENSDSELIEVEKFNHEDNYIYIYKLREHSVD